VEFQLLSLHPDMLEGPLKASILGRAQAAGHFQASTYAIRDHGLGKHRSVDDSPYGGGAGMVMRVDVVVAAIEAVRRPESRVLLMGPGGRPLDQEFARELAKEKHLVLVCGHYEGVDARVLQHVDEEVSVGDFVLTGGELAALVIVDAVARLLPGVLGNAESPVEESFSADLLEYPQYTRPREFRGSTVPEILVGGNHGAIAQWREEASLARTRENRPDLLQKTSKMGKESDD
jgi:tRNA (guanine37-N1)-methyltransferase